MWELKGGKKQIFIKDMAEISLYIDSHLVGKRAKRIFSRRMWMVFGFGLNHTSESSVRAKYTIYLPSFLATIHYYVAFPLVDILFITKEPLLIPKVSRNAYLSGKVPLWIYTVGMLVFPFYSVETKIWKKTYRMHDFLSNSVFQICFKKNKK
jgi:hypothetical protein